MQHPEPKLQNPFNRLSILFQEFLRQEAAGGVILVACAVIAMAWANSAWSSSYHELLASVITVKWSGVGVEKPLLLWINDGLMAVFFFLVGLEIKREITGGELAGFRKAALPAAAAIGGMVVPALFYVAFNWGGEGLRGWAVPMATDIAFAIGALALAGPRVPVTAKVFLVALAIVDDIGAVLVIALFYTNQIHTDALVSAALALLVLAVLNRAGCRYAVPYILVGVVLWYFILKSGVHATVAGVLAALTVPGKPRTPEETGGPDSAVPHGEEASRAHSAHHSLLERMEHALHPWVAFFIMPVFALANAGVTLEPGFLSGFAHPISLGIMTGLFFGKQIGIFGASWLAVRCNLAELPAGVSWRQIHGLSVIAGIGFTMSLFIAALGFGPGQSLDTAKTAVLTASLLAGIVGWLLLRFSPATHEQA
ncbi:Na+/H+ antiporter NhaA [Thermopirellula anaerolimosa]